MIDEGAAIARSEKIDLIIGLGGGSTMDTAKCIGAASTNTKPIWDYIGSMQIFKGIPSFIQIPTLAGTGSELNGGAVVTNWETREKSGFGSPSLVAKTTIIDPELTLTLPRRQTAAGGVDILTHIAEFYLTQEEPLPVNDGWREHLMRIVVKYLPIVLEKEDDLDARTQLSWAATIGLSPLIMIGGTQGAMSCHPMEESISGQFDIIHGEGLAAIYPAWMRHILPVRRERNEMFARNVFGREDGDGTAALEDWLDSIGLKFRLRDLGFDMKYAERIAEMALKQPRTHGHPLPINVKEIVSIFQNAY